MPLRGGATLRMVSQGYKNFFRPKGRAKKLFVRDKNFFDLAGDGQKTFSHISVRKYVLSKGREDAFSNGYAAPLPDRTGEGLGLDKPF